MKSLRPKRVRLWKLAQFWMVHCRGIFATIVVQKSVMSAREKCDGKVPEFSDSFHPSKNWGSFRLSRTFPRTFRLACTCEGADRGDFCQRAVKSLRPEMRLSLETGAVLDSALSRYLRSDCGASL